MPRKSRARNSRRTAACLDPALVARAETVVTAFKARDLTIVTAESCTAGLISAALSEAEGASDVLHGAFVTYTKANKTRALGVPARLLAAEGSVNAKVARKLAAGALAHSPAQIALAITGVLGPEPDEDGNPVGLIYLCAQRRGHKPRVSRLVFRRQPHDRLRRRAVRAAFDLLLKILPKA
ncbi:MAG: CinA family protein [Rhodospirillaceae bacterium]